MVELRLERALFFFFYLKVCFKFLKSLLRLASLYFGLGLRPGLVDSRRECVSLFYSGDSGFVISSFVLGDKLLKRLVLKDVLVLNNGRLRVGGLGAPHCVVGEF